VKDCRRIAPDGRAGGGFVRQLVNDRVSRHIARRARTWPAVARAQSSPAESATRLPAEAGFSDVARLTRTSRALVGYSVTALLGGARRGQIPPRRPSYFRERLGLKSGAHEEHCIFRDHHERIDFRRLRR
jgi:hypothetical protein